MSVTIDYYNQNAESFAADTLSVEFHEIQNRFLSLLPSGGFILDFGCGAGRDTRYFLEHGFRVEAIDGSAEMCRIAQKHTGIRVRQMLFEELDAVNFYDGIWACSSVLHLAEEQLSPVLTKMIAALKSGGAMFLSFKYGEFRGERNGRYFTDFTEENFMAFLETVKDSDRLSVEKFPVFWVSNDRRPERSDEKWLNILLKKK